MEALLTHGPILSYLAITIVLILTGSGLPIPEEVPIIAAGVFSAQGTLNPLVALGCCLVGALVGDIIMYWIGYHFGRGVLGEHRWWSRCVTPEREAKIERMFSRHGLKVFFVARFLVGLRTPVYLTAGILRVSFKRFLLIDLVCATAVVGSFFGLTYWFGEGIAKWIKRGEWGLTVGALIVVACFAFYVWRRYRRGLTLLPGLNLQDILSPTNTDAPNGKGGDHADDAGKTV
jgi:membrane protein DedA with SNARE-associated domain